MNRLAAGLGFPEAPTAGVDETFYVSDVIGGGLRHLSEDGEEIGVLGGRRRGIGGAVLDDMGDPIVTGSDVVALREVDGATVLAAAAGTTGYNDLAVSPEGHLVVGALTYRPLAGGPPSPGRIYVVEADGTTRLWDDGSTVWPNGIAFSPTGEFVYVADFATGSVLRAPWPSHRAALTSWAMSPSGQADGMAVDTGGGVWVALGTGGGVARFHDTGEFDRSVAVPSTFVSSLCFRPGTHEILITTADDLADPTAAGCIFVADVGVVGVPVPPFPCRCGCRAHDPLPKPWDRSQPDQFVALP